MKHAFSCIALAFVFACAAPADFTNSYQQQLEQNHQTWLGIGNDLQQNHAGKWVLIAGGKLHGTWLDFQSAWKTANALADEQQHAYLYRPGVDDIECTFHLSPFLNTKPRWNQLSIRIRQPWKLTIAAVMDTWYRGDQKISWGDAGAHVRLSDGTMPNTHSVRAVASNLFEYDLTLRQADVDALGLGRFTAPTPAFYNGPDHPCRKVLVMVQIPELDIQAPAIAFILPESETAQASFQPTLPAKDRLKTLDQ